MRELWTAVGFGAYLVLLAFLALRAGRTAGRSEAEYYLAGRSLGTWVVALSAVASGRSSWLLLGMSWLAYSAGPSAVWFLPGYIVAELLMFVGPGRRLRRTAEEHDHVTVGDYLAVRYPGLGRTIQLVFAIGVILFITPYVGGQLTAGAKAMDTAFSLDRSAGLWITAAIILAYVVVGGFKAVSWTDVAQVGFMILALVILPAYVVLREGGLDAVAQELRAAGLLSPFAKGGPYLLTGLAVGFGSPGQPHILVRYMSVRSEERLTRAALVGTSWNVVMGWGALWVGLAGRLALEGPVAKETVYPLLAQGYLHPVIFGLAMAALLAAAMSTVDSQVLVVASAITRDWRRARGKPPLPDREAARLGRIASTILVAVAAIAAQALLAGGAEGGGGSPITGLVNTLVLFAWGSLGAFLGPAFLLSLYDPRANGRSCLAAMLTGGVTATVWILLVKVWQVTWISPWLRYELTVAFPLALAVGWLTARLGGDRSPSRPARTV